MKSQDTGEEEKLRRNRRSGNQAAPWSVKKGLLPKLQRKNGPEGKRMVIAAELRIEVPDRMFPNHQGLDER